MKKVSFVFINVMDFSKIFEIFFKNSYPLQDGSARKHPSPIETQAGSVRYMQIVNIVILVFKVYGYKHIQLYTIKNLSTSYEYSNLQHLVVADSVDNKLTIYQAIQ